MIDPRSRLDARIPGGVPLADTIRVIVGSIRGVSADDVARRMIEFPIIKEAFGDVDSVRAFVEREFKDRESARSVTT